MTDKATVGRIVHVRTYGECLAALVVGKDPEDGDRPYVEVHPRDGLGNLVVARLTYRDGENTENISHWHWPTNCPWGN